MNWLTILKKQETYRQAYRDWDVATIAAYGPKDVARLLADPGIVRNRLKVQGSINNAKVVLQIQKEFGSLDTYLWRFVGGKPVQNRWKSLTQIPTCRFQKLLPGPAPGGVMVSLPREVGFLTPRRPKGAERHVPFEDPSSGLWIPEIIAGKFQKFRSPDPQD